MFKEGAFWLKENTPSASVVLNSSWDAFPLLFFYNHENFYCNGMDPTFMYVKNPKIYWTWLNFIARGIVCDREECDEENQKINEENIVRISSLLKENLKGDYLFLEYSEKELTEFLSSSKNFEKVFRKGKMEIYKIH